ncbi:PAS domain S-box protein, partial [bacterium]|nr:PAS domain S-box protein [candidate division CSSED10-310 bacterium]
ESEYSNQINNRWCSFTVSLPVLFYFDIPTADIINKPFHPFVHPDDIAQCEEYIARVKKAKKPLPFVRYRSKHADGTWRWHEGVLSPVFSDNGTFRYFVGVSRDINQQWLAEQALKESESRFRGLLQNVATVAVQGYRMDGSVHYWNKASETFYGYTAEEAIGRNLIDLIIPPALRDQVGEAIRYMSETGTVIPAAELVLMRKDGSTIPVYSSHALVTIPGKEMELFCIDTDLTNRKMAEEEREKLQRQLTHLQTMESVGRLAGGIAHDFNNMLGVILGQTEQLMTGIEPNDPLHAGLDEIRKAAERSTDLARQLLAFARKQTISPRILDLNSAIESLIKILRRLIGEDIRLEWKPAPDIWSVKIDQTQFDQILTNLCVNARDAIAGIGTITIETENVTLVDDCRQGHPDVVPGAYVRVAVEDDGCGMDPDTVSHLFEPFFTTKEIGKGSGLGLATVYGAVRQNGGHINVQTEPGKGTRFEILLPREKADPSPNKTEPVQKSAIRGSETILLVEDEPAILRITKKLLEQMGYTVLPANSPREAISTAQSYTQSIDLVLTDVVMPEMNGRDLVKKLLVFYPNIKRLFMSGYTANVIAHRGVMDQGINFIQKPFTGKELATKVQHVLNE